MKGSEEPISERRASGVVRSLAQDSIAALAQAFDVQAGATRQLSAEVVSMMAHELRSPVAAVLMGLRELERGLPEPQSSEQRRLLEMVERHARRALLAAEDAADLSAIQSGGLRLSIGEVELGALVRRALDAFEQTTAARGVTVEMDASAMPLIVQVDAKRLGRVLTALVAAAAERARTRVVVRVRATTKRARIEVIDDGAALREQVEALLDPYRREGVERAGASARLRLAIARDVISLHGGSLAVSRTRWPSPGVGVRIVLPTVAGCAPLCAGME
jgi:signal transduction histidine kinase